MITHNFLEHLVKSAESDSKDRLFSIIYGLKIIAAIFAFISIVVVWDTLPSRAPFSEPVQYVEQTDTGIDIHYAMVIQKLVDFQITYQAQNMVSGRTVYGSISYTHGGEAVPYSIVLDSGSIRLPDSGQWCVRSTAIWENGLSLRKHTQEFERTCFDVLK